MMTRANPYHPHPTHRHHLQHVGNAGEYHILGTKYTIDGFHYKTNTVYEFHGCFWHGCPKCYPIRSEPHLRLCGRTMQDVYEKTQAKIATILEKGYNVIEMWECKWSKLKQTNPDVQTYVDSLQFVEPLNLRNAFCGGRTNAIKLYHRMTPDQKIHYIDYTSLYPWVNKTCLYPRGHAVFISQLGHTVIRGYLGILQCRVLPPHGLYHPVLLHRHGGKLTFPLCARYVVHPQAEEGCGIGV